jgi:hypothetical protein
LVVYQRGSISSYDERLPVVGQVVAFGQPGWAGTASPKWLSKSMRDTSYVDILMAVFTVHERP